MIRLGAIIIINFILSCCVYATNDKPKLFIMLDVDNTIIDRICTTNKTLQQTLSEQGYEIKHINFTINKEDSFFSYYKKRLIEDNIKFDLTKNFLNIEELVVIRPAIIEMLEAIFNEAKAQNTEVKILICSRKDTTRTKALINSLNLEINGKKFKELVEIVPREFFRVKFNKNGKKFVTKSAKLLRDKYSGKFGKILHNDYVFLIDQLPDSQFIISDHERDFNIMIPSFEVSDLLFDNKSDKQSLREAVNKIKNKFSHK